MIQELIHLILMLLNESAEAINLAVVCCVL
jgi:hypothetical protein